MNLNDTLQNIFDRIKGALPTSWFKDSTPIVDGVSSGCSQTLFSTYQAIQELLPQLRIKTATNGFLDMISGDFFGNNLLRLTGESDDDFRVRILIALFREQGTKKAMSDAIGYFTGVYPKIVEYGAAISANGYVLSKGVDDSLSSYGSTVKAHHCFIDIYNLTAGSSEFGNVGGYGNSIFGYSTPSQGEYIPALMSVNASLLELINSIKPEGTKVWLRFIYGTLTDLQTNYGAVSFDYSNVITDQYGGLLVDTSQNLLTDSTFVQ